MGSDLIDYALAAPLNALGAHGFGPDGGTRAKPAARLREVRGSRRGVITTLESAGSTGRRLLLVLTALGGAATAEQLASETAAAEPSVIKAAIERLTAADLVRARTDGGLELAPAVRELIQPASISMGDQSTITVDELAAICRAIGIQPGSTRKQDRIDAIARAFADREQAARIRAALSPAALALLDRIAAAAGPGATSPESVGVAPYLMRLMPSLRLSRQRTPVHAEAAPLEELYSRGIVGLAPWDDGLWIWREAWPVLDRPFVTNWTVPSEPKVVAVRDAGERLPPVVIALDQALRAWEANPPTVLKNDDPRLGKSDVKATARTLGVDEATLDLASRLAISIGLLLRNVVGRSGRGRNARFEAVWRGDPPLVGAWAALTPVQRWARLVAEWCNPRTPCGHQLLVNRHLVLWELSQLDEGCGYADAAEFAGWFADRYESLGHEVAALECIRDLTALGVISAAPLALTTAGRRLIEDPSTVVAETTSAATTAVVQADLTVIAPPDLHHDLLTSIEEVAELESHGGASIYRISPTRVTRAVQGGRSADEIVDMLAALSPAPLPDTVTRLVRDAAAQAGAVRLLSAPTVVVVSDPADLVTACSIKSLKLTKVTDTVAVTDVPLAQVRTALERKRLAPEVIAAGGAARQAARSSTAEAEVAAQRAAALRAAARGRTAPYFEREAQAEEERARKLSDVDARLAVSGPLTLTRVALESLDRARRT